MMAFLCSPCLKGRNTEHTELLSDLSVEIFPAAEPTEKSLRPEKRMIVSSNEGIDGR